MTATARHYAELASRAIDRGGMLARIFPEAAETTVQAALIYWDTDAAWYEKKRFARESKVIAYVKKKHGSILLAIILPALIHAISRYLLAAYREEKNARKINQLHADLTR